MKDQIGRRVVYRVMELLRIPVAHNILGLLGIQVANYLIPLIAVPYLARVLGRESYGAVVLSQSLALWLAQLLEYGFNLSATRELTRHRGDPALVSEIVRGVVAGQLALSLVAALIATVVLISIKTFATAPTLVVCAFVYAVGQGFNPLWYYQATERVTWPARVQVTCRVASTILLFLLVDDPGDTTLVVALYGLAPLTATTIAYVRMYHEVRPKKPTAQAARKALSAGWNMFVFRGTVSLYTTANALILGFFAPPNEVALFGTAEKISKALTGLLNPVSQAFYPRIVSLAKLNMRLARKANLISGGLMIGSAMLMWVLLLAQAPQIVRLIFGTGYEGAAAILRILGAIVPLIAASNVLGIQWMLPLGLDREFTAVILGAGLLNVSLSLFLAPKFGAVGMAYSVLAAEAFVTISMFTILASRGQLPTESGERG